MLADLRLIWHHADAVLMLDNWKDSKGANLEHHAAQLVGKSIYYRLDEIPANLFCKNCEAPVLPEDINGYYGHCSYDCLKATEVRNATSGKSAQTG